MILITGCTGLVGSHLALHLLQNGETIRATYRTEQSKQATKSLFALYNQSQLFNKIQWIEADILDVSQLESAFQNIKIVYHCAALVSFDPNDEEKLRKINIEGTANIVNFCIDKKVKELCYVSSIAALGDKKEHELLVDENSEWNAELFHNDYAISKYGAEMEIWRGQQEGLNVVIVNPGVILLPLETINIWKSGSSKIYHSIKKGLPFYTKGSTGFVYVNDVVKIMYLLMQQNCFGERYCLISQNISYHKLSQIIANKLHVKPPMIKAKKWMAKTAVWIDWMVSFFLKSNRKITMQMVNSLYTTDLYSNEKVSATLNFEFQKIE